MKYPFAVTAHAAGVAAPSYHRGLMGAEHAAVVALRDGADRVEVQWMRRPVGTFVRADLEAIDQTDVSTFLARRIEDAIRALGPVSAPYPRGRRRQEAVAALVELGLTEDLAVRAVLALRAYLR